MLDVQLSRALKRLFDHGGQHRPVDAKLTVADARRLVADGLADAVYAPKLTLTVNGLAAIPAALALLAAAGRGR